MIYFWLQGSTLVRLGAGVGLPERYVIFLLFLAGAQRFTVVYTRILQAGRGGAARAGHAAAAWQVQGNIFMSPCGIGYSKSSLHAT